MGVPAHVGGTPPSFAMALITRRDVRNAAIFIVCGFLAFVLLVAFMFWRARESLREQRRPLLEAVADTEVRTYFEQLRQRWVGSSEKFDQRVSSAPKRLQDARLVDIHVTRREGLITALTFNFGGADNHFGLVVSKEPLDGKAPILGRTKVRVAESVWYWDEIERDLHSKYLPKNLR